MASIVRYDSYLKNTLNGTANGSIDWDTDTIKLALASSTYTPSQSTHDFFNDITNEVTGSNYTAGGNTLSSIAVSNTGSTIEVGKTTQISTTFSQHASGFTNARYAIIYKSTGTASTSPLFGYIDFTADKGNTTSDLVVQFSVSGIFTIV